MENIEVKVLLSIRCKLGEGIHWNQREGKLLFVDILGQTLYSLDPETLQLNSKKLMEPIGWVLPAANDNKMIIGLKSGIAALEIINDNSQIEWLNKSFPNDPEQRLNDAKADKFGCIWFGSMSSVDESRPIGKLVRLNLKTGNIDIIDEGYTVTNGPAFNQSQTIMLHNDSGRQITYRFDLDARTGRVINKSIWRKFSSEEGYPDGMSFDSKGHIWIAHWGVGRVVQYNLKGEVLLIVQLPVKNVTNICFGGAELNRLFVTSASSKLGDEFSKDCEFDGAVFEITGTNAKGFEGSLPII